MPFRPKSHKPKYRRKSAAERGYNSEWRKFRSRYLALHTWCEVCLLSDRYEPATELDHKLSLRKGGAKFDPANLSPLCKRCHTKKTNREDGGLGRGKQ
jgi:5-methylcytosine-specific restriction protein A